MNGSPEVRRQDLTVEEFMALPDEEGYRLELARGRVVREPVPGPRHGEVAGRVYRTLWHFVDRKGLGIVLFEVAFTLPSGDRTVRIPDIAFVASERVPEEGFTDQFWELAPDLAVEVVSPSNRLSEMQGKALQYLDTGSGMVWAVDPAERTVTVYRSRSSIRILGAGEVVEGGPALPGLEMAVDDLFRGLGDPG